MVLRWSFAFTRKGLEDVFKEVLGTSSGRRLGDALKKGRRDFHFRPIFDVFETKIKTFLRRLCDVIVSAGKIRPKLCQKYVTNVGNMLKVISLTGTPHNHVRRFLDCYRDIYFFVKENFSNKENCFVVDSADDLVFMPNFFVFF